MAQSLSTQEKHELRTGNESSKMKDPLKMQVILY